jgi:hypothetical protein
MHQHQETEAQCDLCTFDTTYTKACRARAAGEYERALDLLRQAIDCAPIYMLDRLEHERVALERRQPQTVAQRLRRVFL